MLRLENVKKQFGAQVVLDGASLALHPGEKAGFIGPNGVGKTTIFRIIEGVEGVFPSPGPCSCPSVGLEAGFTDTLSVLRGSKSCN